MRRNIAILMLIAIICLTSCGNNKIKDGSYSTASSIDIVENESKITRDINTKSIALENIETYSSINTKGDYKLNFYDTIDYYKYNSSYENDLFEIRELVAIGKIAIQYKGTKKSAIKVCAPDTTINSNIKYKKYSNKLESLYMLDGNTEEYINITNGNGDYTIELYENLEGTSYKLIDTVKFKVELKDEYIGFLGRSYYVTYDTEDSMFKSLVGVLAKDADNEYEFINNVYRFVSGFKYNDKLRDKILNNEITQYRTDVTETINSQTGVCVDLSALTASILRSAGYPTKMVFGYENEGGVYHCWNEVYVNGEWLFIDTTNKRTYNYPKTETYIVTEEH